MTHYQTRYCAELLTLQRAGDSIDSLTRTLANARVDLNPHQVDAALFAFRSPLNKGVILADEVGLGKTIEAGLVISQRWAERHRRVLLIVPATLRKQWQAELASKFYLPAVVMDSQTFRQLEAEDRNPFGQDDKIIICSYQFAASHDAAVAGVPWDLVVIDEAHRLRNVYSPRNKSAKVISAAVRGRPKVLLTATPLQNSLLELFGIVSVVDDQIFGDLDAFKAQFLFAPDDETRNRELKARLAPVCTRTLRRQVLEYVPFTERIALTQDFEHTAPEAELYAGVSAYLQRKKLYALPRAQRPLITLVLRKVLASSSFAIARTLEKLVARVEKVATDNEVAIENLFDDEDIDGLDDIIEDEGESFWAVPDLDEVDPEELRREIAVLRRHAQLATGITKNAKGEALIPALGAAFKRVAELGAQHKAVIFTESRRTQQYLFDHLSQNGYAGQIVLMNGTNTDPVSQQIYQDWCSRHAGDGQATGNRAVDIKAAIVEHFRDAATLLLATEAAAEGVNLQFCSLVVNYDLPWNPQRVEQRIGRCHRYGQKHDVVVVNFINRSNAADRRVHELLEKKFKLFDGVFGASDEILGALEGGVDIERRIAQVYQECRTNEEITTAFDALQAELDEQIQSRMVQTRQALLENFDEDVGARLRVHHDKTLESLSERERVLLSLTRAELGPDAEFDANLPRFIYHGDLAAQGTYNFNWKDAERDGENFYRPDHPLAVALVEQALKRPLEPAHLTLNYSGCGRKITILEPLVGKSGCLEVSKLTIESLDVEQFLVHAGQTDDGTALDEETCEKLLQLPATSQGAGGPIADVTTMRDGIIKARVHDAEGRNAKFFDEEVEKLDRWTDDLKRGLEAAIKDLDRQIREQKKASTQLELLEEKLAAQRAIKDLETTRGKKRKELYEAQDNIDARRDELIREVEARLKHKTDIESVLAVRWTVV